MAKKQKKSPPAAASGGFYETLRQRQNRNLLKNAFLAVILLLICAWGIRLVDTNIPAGGEVGIEQPTQASTQGSSAQTTLATQTTEHSQYTEITEETAVTFGTESSQVTEQTQYTEETRASEETEATVATETTEATEEPKETETTEATQPPPPETVPPMQILVTQFSSEVSLIPEVARAFSVRDMSVPVQTAIFQFKKPGIRLDVGLSVKLAVHVEHITEGLSVTSITMEVADNARFENPWAFQKSGSELSVELPHLKVDATYYYRASITFSDQTVQTVESSFKTAATPRLLSIEGIVNVRDIGGWKTVDGKTVRQGLLYRGSELEGAISPIFKLTEKGLWDMRNVLGIRTDMDLRSKYENPDNIHALGEGIEHIHYDASGYTDAFGDYGRKAVQKIFSDLADQSKYPVYLHCTYGADRTGTVCYLLGALLGMSEEDLLREYELSALYHTWVDSQGMRGFIAELKEFEGATIQEKVQTFLLSTGVTKEEIESIQSIFLEES